MPWIAAATLAALFALVLALVGGGAWLASRDEPDVGVAGTEKTPAVTAPHPAPAAAPPRPPTYDPSKKTGVLSARLPRPAHPGDASQRPEPARPPP